MVLAAAVLIVAIIGAGLAWASMNDAVEQAGDAASGYVENAGVDEALTLATVFTWTGGGPRNDIRNSAPFALEGGHQVVTVQSSPVAGEYANPSMGWMVKAADGRDGFEMLNPASFGTSRSDFYLPAGSYYLSSNTLDCSWTLTVQEER